MVDNKPIVAMIPPLAISRIFSTYHFEGGGFVGIVGSHDVDTAIAINMVQTMIDIKREELARAPALHTPREAGE